MKSLLLILLCLPMIGSGQSKPVSFFSDTATYFYSVGSGTTGTEALLNAIGGLGRFSGNKEGVEKTTTKGGVAGGIQPTNTDNGYTTTFNEMTRVREINAFGGINIKSVADYTGNQALDSVKVKEEIMTRITIKLDEKALVCDIYKNNRYTENDHSMVNGNFQTKLEFSGQSINENDIISELKKAGCEIHTMKQNNLYSVLISYKKK